MNNKPARRIKTADGTGGKNIIVTQDNYYNLYVHYWSYSINQYNTMSQWQSYENGFQLQHSEDNHYASFMRQSDDLKTTSFIIVSKDYFNQCSMVMTMKTTSAKTGFNYYNGIYIYYKIYKVTDQLISN